MKWTREETGKYTAGDYTITGKGVKWKLSCDGEPLGTFKGKKLTQKAAEDHEASETPEAPAPTSKAPEAPENLLETLRLNISDLNFQVIALTDAVKRLTKMLKEE